jgi:NTP pyrophosphatase (non-canonical NTP hydrolase)
MSEMQEIIDSLKKFRDDRDWAQFHNPKDLAIALSIEASELLEVFLWKGHQEASPEKIKEELADVFAYAFLLAEKYGLDISQIIREKIAINSAKYPVDKSKGTAAKYDQL